MSKEESDEKRRRGGKKFVDKYGVETAQIYKTKTTTETSDLDKLVIPPPTHALYDPSGNTTFDPLRVKEIDKAGAFYGVIKIWTDPDTDTLYVIDGRGNVHDCREVNRRRKERGAAPISVRFMPVDCDIQKAREYVTMYNTHRKGPTPSFYGREIHAYKNLGYAWDRICELLHVESENPEQWCRLYYPLAWCVEEVQAAFDTHKLPVAKAKMFGGTAIDGSKRLGDNAQRDLLKKELAKKAAQKSGTAPKPIKTNTASGRLRLAVELVNTKHLSETDRTMVRFIAAYERYISGGEKTALDFVPGVKSAVDAALSRGKDDGEAGTPDAASTAA